LAASSASLHLHREVDAGTPGTASTAPPAKARVRRGRFRLDRVCVNDPGHTGEEQGSDGHALKAEGKQHCATLGGVAEVPSRAPRAGDGRTHAAGSFV
jgi:hypothetical protein